MLFMVPLGPPSARPMAQALRLPFEYYIYIVKYSLMLLLETGGTCTGHPRSCVIFLQRGISCDGLLTGRLRTLSLDSQKIV